MRRSQKSKRITWASGVNLCQVRLFSSDEPPSKVGMSNRDHLQAEPLWPVESAGDRPDDDLPPGFEEIQPANLWRVQSSQIPLMKWRCPPRFHVNSQWQVVAGEESRETEAQKQREMRVLEAVYPRPSAIPLNPSALVNVHDSIAADSNIPVVPVTPVEDVEAGLDPSSGSLTANGSFSSRCSANVNASANGTSATATEPDIVAAAQAAFSSLISDHSSIDQANLIDRDLLIRILGNPKMVQQHIASSAAPFSTQNLPSTITDYAPNLKLPLDNSFDPVPTNIAINRIDRPLAAQISTSLGAPLTKGINYYRSLIQQHGGERRDAPPQSAHQSNQAMGTSREPLRFMTSKGSRSRTTKPCVYFNTSRGCRNGAKCAYQHDSSSRKRINGRTDVQSVKRVKLEREIIGT